LLIDTERFLWLLFLETAAIFYLFTLFDSLLRLPFSDFFIWFLFTLFTSDTLIVCGFYGSILNMECKMKEGRL